MSRAFLIAVIVALALPVLALAALVGQQEHACGRTPGSCPCR